MAVGGTFTLDEVMDELERDDLFEDESEDEFDGYLDGDIDGDMNRDTGVSDEDRDGDMDACRGGDRDDWSDEREQCRDEGAALNVGENIEIGASSDDDEFVPEYILQPGCSANVEGNSPLSYFSLLVTNDMLEHIVSQTNIYANQFIANHDLAPHSRVRRWSKAVHDVCELLRFLAIVIVMGIVRYPQMESHWSTLWPYSNSHFASVSVYK